MAYLLTLPEPSAGFRVSPHAHGEVAEAAVMKAGFFPAPVTDAVLRLWNVAIKLLLSKAVPSPVNTNPPGYFASNSLSAAVAVSPKATELLPALEFLPHTKD